MAIRVGFIGQNCDIKSSSVRESWESAPVPPRVGDKVSLLVYAGSDCRFEQRLLRVTEVIWCDPENVAVYVTL